MRRTVVAIALLAVAAPAGAQLATLPAGARVRFTAPPLGLTDLTGRVVAVGDTLEVAPAGGGAPVRVPAASLTYLDVSRGRSRLLGARRGALYGAAAGFLIGVWAGQDDPDRCDSLSPVDWCRPGRTADWLASNALGGALYGAIAGALVRPERWVGVPLR